jgi:site-specific DNA-methyltransferase (adenine-specific)
MPVEREQIGACTLYRGDCREVLPTLDAVDAVITDPPYGVELTAKRMNNGHGRSGTTVRHGHYSHPDTADYLQTVVLPALDACLPLAQCTVVMPGIRHLWAYPPAEDVGCFYSPAGTGMGRWGFTCMHPILYYGKDPYLAYGRGSRPNSRGQIYPNDANEQAHPCAKPLPMMTWLVARASLEGHSVLDPFMGSGTTGVACVQLGRSFVGIEIDPRYFDIACQRITTAYAQPDLFVSIPARPTQPPLLVAGGQ